MDISGFAHWKWWFSSSRTVNVDQRVIRLHPNFPGSLGWRFCDSFATRNTSEFFWCLTLKANPQIHAAPLPCLPLLNAMQIWHWHRSMVPAGSLPWHTATVVVATWKHLLLRLSSLGRFYKLRCSFFVLKMCCKLPDQDLWVGVDSTQRISSRP